MSEFTKDEIKRVERIIKEVKLLGSRVEYIANETGAWLNEFSAEKRGSGKGVVLTGIFFLLNAIVELTERLDINFEDF